MPDILCFHLNVRQKNFMGHGAYRNRGKDTAHEVSPMLVVWATRFDFIAAPLNAAHSLFVVLLHSKNKCPGEPWAFKLYTIILMYHTGFRYWAIF